MRKKKLKKLKRVSEKEKNPSRLSLPKEAKKYIGGILLFLIAIIIILSFFELAGVAGKALIKALTFLIGKAVFITPLALVLGGLIFFSTKYKNFFWPAIISIFILISGASGFLESNLSSNLTPPERGGWLGYFISWPFLKFFGFLVTQIVFLAIIIIGCLISWYLLTPHLSEEEKRVLAEMRAKEEKKPLITRIWGKVAVPKFKVKEVPPIFPEKVGEAQKKVMAPELKIKEITQKLIPKEEYQRPPLELLDTEKGSPSAGDIRQNSAIIKRTLENFAIPVEMSEINIGPTVTQYTLKPAEGIKLSKITALSNDLALALASHPIRIEAPIPGRPLVGIEVPNKIRAQVRLRDLISNLLQTGGGWVSSNLTFVLGRDVSGNPVYADLAKMPHLLVAGSTGTGKTIFLNSLILTLLYRNSPEILRFILIDPKRVEFPIYNELPHLLCPVIYDAQKTINALKWLILEMERRFDILSESKARDISSYNEMTINQQTSDLIPYIILIIDELADLMAAKGREMEAGIVRLAQMARAVGIHLVVATQRPSVEVITGLIKANITSRVTFQVASQVDSRTVLDMAGAEKLLGLGDMLYLSAEIVKPKRIQGAFVSEKEVKRVVNFIKSKVKIPGAKIEEEIFQNKLAEDLGKSLEASEGELGEFYTGEDPLYEEAKRVVREARKASASLLQRRLRIGYARAARLIDMLEEKGVVGPGEGAKPREVYFESQDSNP